MPELLDRRHVSARGDEALSELRDHSQLLARSLEVLVPYPWRQAEVVDLGWGAHGLQDITSLCFDLMDQHAVGLCATCRWVRIVRNNRGSVFYRCSRADTDPRFVRYPPLPVLSCPGYDRLDAPPGTTGEPERDRDEG